MSITTLADALVDDQDLRIVQLGHIWVEEKVPRRIAGNLEDKSKLYKIGRRKTVRLKASDWLAHK